MTICRHILSIHMQMKSYLEKSSSLLSSDKTWCGTAFENFSCIKTVISVRLSTRAAQPTSFLVTFRGNFYRLHVVSVSYRPPCLRQFHDAVFPHPPNNVCRQTTQTSKKRDVFSLLLHVTVRNGKPLKQTTQAAIGSHHELTFWAWRQRSYHGKIKDGGQIDLINLSLLWIHSFGNP